MKKRTTLFIILIYLTTCSYAQIIHVPADKTTIQAGIDSASNGDTVLVAENTYFENINFKGKAITVASEFVLDGDTSHISKTIIDGSQSAIPDTGSTVLMVSGEDTTSVLTGFTITGGTGTKYDIGDDTIRRDGGGVFIFGSGGKVEMNIIEGNAIEDTLTYANLGGGICAIVFNDHTAILRNNQIMNNRIFGNITLGGGVSALSGRLICEGNRIEGNSIRSKGFAMAGGIYYEYVEDYEGSIDEVIIRNNIITMDTMFSANSYGGGGGLGINRGAGVKSIQVYNNLICKNCARAGGGIILWPGNGSFYNNTIADNISEEPVNSECNIAIVYTEQRMVFYNNIIANSITPEIPDFKIFFSEKQEIYLVNNMISQPNSISEKTTAYDNFIGSPDFKTGTYELAEGSPGIAWGIDSLEVNGDWFYAPPFDYYGNPRPHACDGHSDLGAVESEYLNPYCSNAYLSYIGYKHGILYPDFHRDTLDYEMVVPDTTIITPFIDAISEDKLAEIDINHAADISSPDEADRTTTITVTADDGITDTIYTVLFRYISSNAILDTLYPREGTLVPDFDPDTTEYQVIVSDCEALTGVGYEASCPYATVIVDSADDPCSNWYNKTIIKVTAEDGITKKTYEIEFENVDAVEEFNNSTGPALYPNPFHSFLTIYMNNNQQISKVEILSMDGRLVRIIDHVDSPKITLHRENLSPGMYFIRVYSDKKYVRKVMIR